MKILYFMIYYLSKEIEHIENDELSYFHAHLDLIRS